MTVELNQNKFKDSQSGELFAPEIGRAEYGDTNLHILIDRYGLIRGDERVTNYTEDKNQDINQLHSATANTLLTEARTSDVVIILLSTSKFNSIVHGNWDDIVNNAKENSIWGFGAAPSSLALVDFWQLKDKGCKVITYERVGVARLSNATRTKLLDAIKE